MAATTSEVKSAMDAIATVIRDQRTVVNSAKTKAAGAATALNALPGDYAAVIAAVNAYTGADAFETVTKAELARMTTEFTALVSAANSIANTAT